MFWKISDWVTISAKFWAGLLRSSKNTWGNTWAEPSVCFEAKILILGIIVDIKSESTKVAFWSCGAVGLIDKMLLAGSTLYL